MKVVIVDADSRTAQVEDKVMSGRGGNIVRDDLASKMSWF